MARAAAIHSRLLGSKPRAMFCQSLLDVVGGLDLELLGWALRILTRGRVTGGSISFRLRLVEVLNNSLVVLLDDILRDTLHTKDLDVESLSVGQRIFDRRQRFFMYLVHMNRKTCW